MFNIVKISVSLCSLGPNSVVEDPNMAVPIFHKMHQENFVSRFCRSKAIKCLFRDKNRKN